MIMAYVTADREALFSIFSDPDKFYAAAPYTFLVASVIILLFGPGQFALDTLLRRMIGVPATSESAVAGKLSGLGCDRPFKVSHDLRQISVAVAKLPELCAIVLLLASFPARADDMTSTLLIGSSRIDVTIDSGDLKVSQADLMHWVQWAAEAVATYYGRYPVPHAGIRIMPVRRERHPPRPDVPAITAASSRFGWAQKHWFPNSTATGCSRTKWCTLRSRRWKTIIIG